jgi:hypothetical protein
MHKFSLNITITIKLEANDGFKICNLFVTLFYINTCVHGKQIHDHTTTPVVVCTIITYEIKARIYLTLLNLDNATH